MIRRFIAYLAAAVFALAPISAAAQVSYGIANGIATAQGPEIWRVSGTWKHPAPGTSIDILIACIGGGGGGGSANTGSLAGGGGGSGRFTLTTATGVTADQTITIGAGGSGGTFLGNNATAGGTTSMGALCSVAGGSPGTDSGTSNGVGGNGGAGGGGGWNGTTGGVGGNGLDGPGGGGGKPAGAAGTSVDAGALVPQPGNTNAGGLPNGGGHSNAGGGDLTPLYPFLMGCGRGGTGTFNSNSPGGNGRSGCVFIWYYKLRQ